MFRSVKASTFLIVGLLTPSVSAQLDDAAEKVTIKGQVFEIYPPEKLAARGFDVADIPRDQNAAWVYVDAFNAAVDLPQELRGAYDAALDGRWPEGKSGRQLADWLQQNEASLDLVRRAAAMKQHDMPFLKGDTDAMIMVLLPTLSHARHAAKTLSVQAAWHLSQGDATAAIDNYLVCQRMANHVGDCKTLIEGLVAMAVSGLADKGLMHVAQSGRADPEILKAAVAEMEALAESIPTFEQMMRAEQQWADAIIDDMFEVPGLFSAMTSGGDLQAIDPDNGWHRLATRLKRLYLPDRTVKKHYKRHFDTLIKASRREDGLPSPPLEEDKLFQQIPAWDLVSQLMLPSLARAHELTLRAESNQIRARLTMAVEAYKAEQGHYPPTLSSLVPEYASSVPADPMTSYNFEYRPAGGAQPSVKGLERVTRENEAELLKKRRAPAILNPRASRWRRYVRSVSDRYQFTGLQRASAEAVLRDMEARAARYEQAQGVKLQASIEAGDAKDLERRMGPLDKMFKELQQRVRSLATAKQRAGAEKEK